MSAPAVEVGEVSDAEEFDVIAACQLWLELDFPDQSTTDPSTKVPTEKGDPR